MIAAFIWFILITVAVVLALPRVLDALLYYFDKRSSQLNQEVELQQRKLEIMREQRKLQMERYQGQQPRRVQVK